MSKTASAYFLRNSAEGGGGGVLVVAVSMFCFSQHCPEWQLLEGSVEAQLLWECSCIPDFAVFDGSVDW